MAREFDKTIKITLDTDQANKSINELEKDIKDLNLTLDDVGIDQAQANKIKKNLENISKATDEVTANAREYSDALVEAGVRITQAFVTTTGTILSFATSEEDAAATTAKLSQAMAIADSIEQVYNATKAIGELRTKALAVAEAQKTAAVAAGTVATEGATVATTFLGRAIQFMLGPIGLVIAGVTALVGIYSLFRKSAADTAKEQDKLNESVNNFAEVTDKASAAQAERNRSNIKDNIANQRQAIKDEQKATEDRSTFLINEEKTLVAQIQKLRDEGAAFDSKEIKEKEDRLFANRFTDQVANQALINNLVKKASDFEIDVATEAKNQILDLDIEKLASNQDLVSKKIVLEKEYEKEVNDLNARIAKGDSTAIKDREIADVKYINNKIQLNNEALDIELAKRNEITDKELQNLSLIDTKTARFQEIELNRQKAIDEYNTAISKNEIKSAEELDRINNDAKTQTLALLKEIQSETEAINNETKQISLDLLVSDLNTLSQDIGEDLSNQLKAISEITLNDLDKLNKKYNEDLGKIKDLNTEEGKAQVKALEENYKAQVKVIKKGEEDATKVVQENAKLRTFAEKSAQQDILESSTNTLNKIVKNEKEVLAVRLDANQQLVDIQLKRLELQEQEEIRLAENAKKTQFEINAIIAKYKVLKDTVIDTGKATEKALKLEPVIKAIEKTQKALLTLSEIKVFSDNAGINNFLNVITGLEKGLYGALEVFKKFKLETLTAEDVAAFASSLVEITSSIVQTAFQQNIDAFDEQLNVLAEKKAEIDEDLQTSTDRIKELQGNLAQANIEDRNRIIKLIDIERNKEKQLQEQKRKAAEEERQLQQRKKEEQKKAFEAQKAAAIIQAGIAAALGVVGALGNQPFTPFNLVLAGIVGALGAVQVGIIASQPTPEFFVGGHTEQGDSREVAGVVHKNEWVAPAWMTKSPKYKNTIQELEAARQGGFASGGFTSDEQVKSNSILDQTIKSVAALANRPVVVSVQEINSVSNNVTRVQARSTL